MNKYIILLIVIPIIVLSNYIAFSFAEAEEDKFECTVLTPPFMCQDHIIKQLDWNNCAIAHKDTHGYEYEYEMWSGKTASDYKELVRLCGEMP